MKPLPTSNAQRVLIVDDNEDLAISLSLLLMGKGHEVQVVGGGQDALASAAAWKPSVVFLDISLPDLDGFEVARRLRREHGPSAFRLIALTGLDQDGVRERGVQAGFDDFLHKPAEPDELFRAVEPA